jgi:hypothetical protein
MSLNADTIKFTGKRPMQFGLCLTLAHSDYWLLLAKQLR